MSSEGKRETLGSLIKSTTLLLVDFYAEWCGPCRMMKPILEELKQRVSEKVTIIKIDVDRSPQIAALYQIQGVPTLVLFKEGQPVWRNSGVVPVAQLEQVVGRYI